MSSLRFRYIRDPLFLLCCSSYWTNRWLLKPRVESSFLRFWFNDLLLVPCAVPVVFWLFRLLKLRENDDPPALFELTWILIVWSLLFEWLGPKLVARATGDWRDVLMYWSGGVFAWLFWHRGFRHQSAGR